MHTYTLTIIKDDFWLEFKSTDKYIVEKELGVWIDASVEFLEETKEQRLAELQVAELQPEKIELGSIIVEKQTPVIPEKIKEPAQKELSKSPVVQAQEEPPKNIYKISDETKEILQKAIHKPKLDMKEILEEQPPVRIPDPIEIAQPVNAASEPKPVFQSLPPLPAASVNHEVPAFQEIPVPQQDFTTVFNQKIVQENTRTDKFAQLLSLPNINNKFNCLIACAYHLVERENFERFTLKQINTISKALLEEAIEHDTLKEALERRFIKIVPDYTGIATTMEYTLTDQGIKYFEREIAE